MKPKAGKQVSKKKPIPRRAKSNPKVDFARAALDGTIINMMTIDLELRVNYANAATAKKAKPDSRDKHAGQPMFSTRRPPPPASEGDWKEF